jgi:hypothetical protein
MSTFGDHEPDDTFDATGGPPDLLPVAIRIHEARMALARLAGESEPPEWERLGPGEHDAAMFIVRDLIEWLTREGAFGPTT